MKVFTPWSSLLLAAVFLLWTTAARAAAPEKHCTAPEYRQFDFWAGDWDVFDTKTGSREANARVDRILDGCVLREQYDGTNGSTGQSFNIYDPSRGVWRQIWVNNRGQLLFLEGKLEGGELDFSGSQRTLEGKEEQVRGQWKPVQGGVQETAQTSLDGGRTWTPWFDLTFRPAAATGAANSSEDERAVAALDREYQAAVKKNDATTMDRLLADDFVLVTGSGKTYSKADLLEEARSGRIVYEHQEDSEQKVRLWGNAAVVTAKLWEKGTDSGKPFNKVVWFSDTYVRTATGWRYVFGQSSLAPQVP